MALRSRVTTCLPAMRKAWPAEPFEVDASAYLRIGDVSTTPTTILVATNKPHLRTGILIVTLVHPLTASAGEVYKDIAGQIAEHFYDGLSMRYLNACVTVDGAPHVQDGYLDNGYWTVPVAINWRCFL